MKTRRLSYTRSLLVLLYLLSGCTKRYVCPDYFTAFHFGEKVNEQFFSYFVPAPLTDSVVYGKAQKLLADIRQKNDHGMLMFDNDTIPKDIPFMRGPQANQFGLREKNPPLFDRIIPSRQQNFNRIVLARITIHKPDTSQTVIFDPTLKEEEYVIDSTITGDAPPVPVLPTPEEKPTTATSNINAPDSVSNPQKQEKREKKMIPDSVFFKGANWDQIVYNYTIGKKIMDYVDSMRPKWEAELEAQRAQQELNCQKKLSNLFGLLCKKIEYDSLGNPIEKPSLLAKIFKKKKTTAETDTVYNEFENEQWYAKTEEEELQENEFDIILQVAEQNTYIEIGKGKKSQKSKKKKKPTSSASPSETPKPEETETKESEQSF
ncbi:MAG: hypothetical protein NZM38_07370 [Cytophagales bacterium]|nr:hypothetical protein [Cytophagales bacterium]MDW8384577.1 hypothetical protein [Flammeovirgaceae bacterium]